jgi:hypothetical protein
MRLAPLRYTKIDGTRVMVTVNSAAEAKAALKELRHKKRELKFMKRILSRQLRAARARQHRSKYPPTFWRWVVASLKSAAQALWRQIVGAREPPPPKDAAAIQREIQTTDEVLHNIDGCILQLEGKLLHAART